MSTRQPRGVPVPFGVTGGVPAERGGVAENGAWPCFPRSPHVSGRSRRARRSGAIPTTFPNLKPTEGRGKRESAPAPPRSPAASRGHASVAGGTPGPTSAARRAHSPSGAGTRTRLTGSGTPLTHWTRSLVAQPLLERFAMARTPFALGKNRTSAAGNDHIRPRPHEALLRCWEERQSEPSPVFGALPPPSLPPRQWPPSLVPEPSPRAPILT